MVGERGEDAQRPGREPSKGEGPRGALEPSASSRPTTLCVGGRKQQRARLWARPLQGQHPRAGRAWAGQQAAGEGGYATPILRTVPGHTRAGPPRLPSSCWPLNPSLRLNSWDSPLWGCEGTPRVSQNLTEAQGCPSWHWGEGRSWPHGRGMATTQQPGSSGSGACQGMSFGAVSKTGGAQVVEDSPGTGG